MVLLRKYLTFIATMLFIVVYGTALLPSAMADNVNSCHVEYAHPTLEQTADDSPQWSDLGMENLLVAGFSASFEAPASAGQMSGRTQTHHFSSRLASKFGCEVNIGISDKLLEYSYSLALPSRAVDYYIFFIYCMRL